MDRGKIFTVFLWIGLVINYLLDFYYWVNYFALVLLAIHIVEYLVFFKRIRNSNEGVVKGLLLTLVFGVLYIGSLRKD